MMNKNILLINHYAGSIYHGQDYRHYYLAREWKKIGYNVRIVAASFSHVRNKQPSIKGEITSEIIDDIQYIWIRTPKYKKNNIKRAINIFSFVWKLYKYKNKILKNFKPDVVIASSIYPLDIFPARSIAKKYNAKLIFEVRDLWPLTLLELGGMPKWHPFIVIMQIAEDYAYRNSDKIVSMFPKAKEYMIKHGMSSDKFIYIPNGINIEDWKKSNISLAKSHEQVINKIKKEGKFIVGYAGTFGFANALHYLIDAAYLLKNRPIAFILVGQGLEKETLQQRIKRLGLDNVIFLPPISKMLIPALLDKMDVLYIGWRRSPLYRFGVSPSKLMDYMMAGKPIIHAIEAGNDIVSETKCGISIEPENPKAIADAIIKLMKISEKERKIIGERGEKYVLENHDYRVLAKKFLEAIE